MGLTLDIGCGSHPRGNVGLDLNPTWKGSWHIPTFYDAYTAPRNPHADIVVADANHPLPFRDGAFTAVFMVHVLEHLYRPLDCLREVHRVLKPGGKLVLFTPNARVSKADWLDGGHIISFTEPTLRRLLLMAFSRVDVTVMSDPPFHGEDLKAEATKD